MRMNRRHILTIVGVVISIAGAIALGTATAESLYLSPQFLIVIAAAVLTAAYAPATDAAEDRGTMLPSFVIEFISLLLFGAVPATITAAVGIVVGPLARSATERPTLRTLVHAVSRLAAIQAAGQVYHAVGGVAGPLVWPLQGALIATALAAYCLVNVILVPLVSRLIAKQTIDRAWLTSAACECANYVSAAGAAVVIVELLQRAMWSVLPIAAVPLVFAYRGYCHHLAKIEDAHRNEQAADASDVGLCVVGADGRVTSWNEAIQRLIGCARDVVLGRPLATAVPSLRNTAVLKTIEQVLKDQSPRTLMGVPLPADAGGRIVDIKFAPRPDGVLLQWQDVTERVQSERHRDRLALAVDGAHDGLWEWDLGTRELYVSARWKAMLGIGTPAGVCGPDEWLQRIHPEDLTPFRDGLKACVEQHPEPFVRKHRMRHEDGSYRWFLCRGVAGGPGRKPSRVAGSLTDITDRVIAEEQVRTAGFLDSLTGLRNRADFEIAVGQRIERFRQRPDQGKFAVLYLDLDRFKIVNDSLGHPVGDQMLVAVSRRLESCLKDTDVLSRFGGDEFAILMSQIDDGGQANALALRIQDALSTPMTIAGREVFTSASIGIAFGHAEYQIPDEIMRDADASMYQAKTNGKGRHEVFDADMHTRARDRLEFESDLRRAVSANDFEVHYQPIVLLDTRMCVGFESLVRWKRNDKMVSPALFIPIAEELGLIETLGTWILHQACHTFADWQRRFPDSGLEYITVNASGRQLTQPTFVFEVEQAMSKSGLKPSTLRIEITETALMDNPRHAVDVLTRLREMGVKIYLDDFGTGYSSLSHLHKLPVDVLKIDQSFVKSMLQPDRPAMVESILALAHTMKTGVVAEGIEDDRTADELTRLGCTHAQGYLFSRPLAASVAEALIAANGPLPTAPAHLAATA
jgi:diguanylate cyclase (GGDEF)-like protein/PAS domain S-box-containing protein